VFMSTHTLDVAEAVADRIGIINGGRLIALGTLDELQATATAGGRLEDIFLQLTEEAEEERLAVSGLDADDAALDAQDSLIR